MKCVEQSGKSRMGVELIVENGGVESAVKRGWRVQNGAWRAERGVESQVGAIKSGVEGGKWRVENGV